MSEPLFRGGDWLSKSLYKSEAAGCTMEDALNWDELRTSFQLIVKMFVKTQYYALNCVMNLKGNRNKCSDPDPTDSKLGLWLERLFFFEVKIHWEPKRHSN